MTDLLQSAVSTGTGRAAQIGRPVAGKTGTTSSNKDGYFVGFSSGVTTGVWMGRDDSRVVPGLQGGTAPARAFAAYMRVAVAKRPVEQFQTELQLPDWQLEPDDEVLMGDPGDYYYTDEQGNLVERGRPPAEDGPGDPFEGDTRRDQPPFPIEGERPPATAPEGDQAASDAFLDQATGADRPAPTPRPAVRPSPRPFPRPT